jgi:hypothetical protein
MEPFPLIIVGCIDNAYWKWLDKNQKQKQTNEQNKKQQNPTQMYTAKPALKGTSKNKSPSIKGSHTLLNSTYNVNLYIKGTCSCSDGLYIPVWLVYSVTFAIMLLQRGSLAIAKAINYVVWTIEPLYL